MREGDKSDKTVRVLQMYAKLSDGYVIQKAQEAQTYSINERSIQRDMDDIRNFLDMDAERTGIVNSIVYDRLEKGYRLEALYKLRLTNSEILALCKILLDMMRFVKWNFLSIDGYCPPYFFCIFLLTYLSIHDRLNWLLTIDKGECL